MRTILFSRHGGYECSSKGDRRFSAFYATLPDGRTIEQAYQLDVKGYRKFGNNPMLGKGKPPLKPFPEDSLWLAYLDLWRTWAIANPTLLHELRELAAKHSHTLSDMFATSAINQARALATLLNEMA
ncbi:hypothetical protein OH491_24750 [Termitidicoccus mucosus]|uniref:Uncharacterized protein n=1 Tax=Termitidicoccus mucosus TaxID=1184151 RepID=A0A178IPH1_9BACT|nr:hypothetical protein AW736_01775 [Opitutaceae bacterium TSB47]